MKKILSPAAMYMSGMLCATLLCTVIAAPAQAGDDTASDESTTEPKADTAVVVPYETRTSPTHEVDLKDDRVYFLKKLEQNGDTYVLHTMEDEVIEVKASDIEKIVEFKKKE